METELTANRPPDRMAPPEPQSCLFIYLVLYYPDQQVLNLVGFST